MFVGLEIVRLSKVVKSQNLDSRQPPVITRENLGKLDPTQRNGETKSY